MTSPSQIKLNKDCFINIDTYLANHIIDTTRGSEFHTEWEEFATNMNYVHRWVIKKQSLPSVIKMKIIKWIRGNESNKKMHEPIAVALEVDNPKLLLPDES